MAHKQVCPQSCARPASRKAPMCPPKAASCPAKAPKCPSKASVCPSKASVCPPKAPVCQPKAPVCPSKASVCPSKASVCPQRPPSKPKLCCPKPPPLVCPKNPPCKPPTPPARERKPKKKKGTVDLTDEQKALVMDNYYPGLIHDSVNQNTDFNEVAKRFVTPETAIDGDKAEKGMSLLEAFDTRVKLEQSTFRNLVSVAVDKTQDAGDTAYKPVYGPSAHPIVSDIVLEENVRAAVIPVDLQQYVRTRPESDPVRAISCLTRAQKLNDFYKEYRGAQKAANLAPPDKIEQAAVYGAKSFQIENLNSETKSVESNYYKPLELVSYIGITKPV